MTKYAHLFVRPSPPWTGVPDDQYLFCNNLGSGVSGCAQLVLHVGSNTACVRKTLSPRIDLDEMNQTYNTIEIQVLRYLQNQPANDRPQYINGLRDVHDIYPPAGAEIASKPFRLIYLEYCNGGDLGALYTLLSNSGVGMSRRLLLRLVKQMLTAINYLYTRTQPIMHRDVKPENIFCNWTSAGTVDFHLGDFGFSTMGAENTENASGDIDQLINIFISLADLPGRRPGSALDTPAHDALFDAIIDEMNTLVPAMPEDDETDVPDNVLPDLTNVMALVAQIPDDAAVVAEPWREYNVFGAHVRPVVPAYYDSRDECLQPHMRGTAVHGPWHVATVSPYGGLGSGRVIDDARSGEMRVQVSVTFGGGGDAPPVIPGPRVEAWEPEVHHRPHADLEDEQSEDEDEDDV